MIDVLDVFMGLIVPVAIVVLGLRLNRSALARERLVGRAGIAFVVSIELVVITEVLAGFAASCLVALLAGVVSFDLIYARHVEEARR